MRKHVRTVLYVVVLLIVATFMLFGCVNDPKVKPNLNYPFTIEGLKEETLKRWDDLKIISRSFGSYIEKIIFAEEERILFSGETSIIVFENVYTIEYNLNMSKLENGELNLLDPQNMASIKFKNPNQQNYNELGFKEGLLFANIWVDGLMEEYTADLNDIPSFGAIQPGMTESSLYTLLGYMSFVSENSRYGKKIENGKEVSELLVCADLYSSLRALLRLLVSKCGMDYGDAAKSKLQAKLNELSELLFSVPYDKLGDLPIVYINMGIVMRDGVAEQLKINVSPNAMFGKPK